MDKNEYFSLSLLLKTNFHFVSVPSIVVHNGSPTIPCGSGEVPLAEGPEKQVCIWTEDSKIRAAKPMYEKLLALIHQLFRKKREWKNWKRLKFKIGTRDFWGMEEWEKIWNSKREGLIPVYVYFQLFFSNLIIDCVFCIFWGKMDCDCLSPYFIST